MLYLRKSQQRQTKFNPKEEGSISIFLALSLVLVLSFLFSMTEAARVNGLQQLAKRKLELELESLFGAYNQELWEHYGMLFLDASYGNGEPDIRLLEEHIMEADYAEGKESHFYQMDLKGAEVKKYAIATDWEGAEFRRQACQAARECVTKAGLDYLKEQISRSQQLEGEEGLEEKWENALEAEEEAEDYKKEAEENGEPLPEVPEEPDSEPLPENPISYVTELKTSALLTLVLENPSELSGKAINRADSIDNRTLFLWKYVKTSGKCCG